MQVIYKFTTGEAELWFCSLCLEFGLIFFYDLLQKSLLLGTELLHRGD